MIEYQGAPPVIPTGDFLITLLGSKGKELASASVALSNTSESADPVIPETPVETTIATIFAIMPKPTEQIAAIETRHQGTVVGMVTASKNAPSVQLVNAGLYGDTVTMSWVASDKDADPLTYTTACSINDGKTWQVLGIDQINTTISVHRSQLPGGDEMFCQVQASDGLLYGRAISDKFFVPN